MSGRDYVEMIMESYRPYGDHAVLLVVIVLTILLNFWNNDFPFGLHPDEKKKVRFVQTEDQDFHHPILMIQAGRVINQIVQTRNKQELLPYLRSVSAISGLLLVVTCFYMSRRMLSGRHRIVTALAISASPILVVHAHYYKEDMIFAAFAYLSLFLYLKYLDHRSKQLLLALGIAMGLALSAQYKAMFLFPLFLIFPFFESRVDQTGLLRKLLLMFVVATVVFLVVNYPAVLDPQNFMSGIGKQTMHVANGHVLRHYPLPNLFSFHLINSLVPGLTIPVILASVTGMTFTIINWKKCSTGLHLLFFFVLIYYLIHEITPMKAWPAFIRYMVPCAPALIIFAVKGILDLGQWIKGRTSAAVASSAMVALLSIIIIYPLCISVVLLYNINERDTRIRAKAWLEEQGEEFVAERYALPLHRDITSLSVMDINELQQRGVRYLVASSFQYGRFDFGSKLQRQRERVYQMKDQYDVIFEFPYHEIKPYYKSYAFSNPLIRIVDIQKLPNLPK